MIATSRVLKHFGSVAKTAEFFGCAPQAIYQWDKYIPEAREWELKARLPDEFGEKTGTTA